MKRQLSFKVKFIALISAFICLLVTIISGLFSRSTVKTAVKISGETGLAVVQTAQELIDGDKFANLAQSLDGNDPYYEELRLALLGIKQGSSCRFLYTMAQKSGTTFNYVVDGSCDPSDTENFSPLGTEEDISSYGVEPFTAMKRNVCLSSNLKNQEAWGWIITSYAPIRDSSGRSVGFVASDFDARPVVKLLVQNIINTVIISMLLILATIAGILAVMSPFFSRMNSISQAMRQIAQGEGDLTLKLEVNSSDEIGRLAESCNAVTDRLRNMVITLKSSMQTLSETGQSLNVQTEQTISFIKEANGGMQTINHQTQQQADTMGSVYNNVKSVEGSLTGLNDKLNLQSQAISSSSAAIEELTANISSITDSVNRIADEYAQLVTVTQNGRRVQETVNEKISLIVSESHNLTEANAAINNIAEQTNLLAMNAAIEAAHAGTAGKGFGVVADEIRHLAETSAQQSAAIKELIEQIDDSISSIVQAISLSSKSFADIGGQVSTINTFMLEIKNGMNEQHIGANSILEKINVLNTSTADITELNRNMKTESSKLFSGMDELRRQSSSILNEANRAAARLNEIQAAAEMNGIAAKENLHVSAEVHSLVNKFKTQE